MSWWTSLLLIGIAIYDVISRPDDTNPKEGDMHNDESSVWPW